MTSKSKIPERFDKVRQHFEKRQFDMAKRLLQECIDDRPVLTKGLIRKYLESTEDDEIKHYLHHMFSINYA